MQGWQRGVFHFFLLDKEILKAQGFSAPAVPPPVAPTGAGGRSHPPRWAASDPSCRGRSGLVFSLQHHPSQHFPRHIMGVFCSRMDSMHGKHPPPFPRRGGFDPKSTNAKQGTAAPSPGCASPAAPGLASVVPSLPRDAGSIGPAAGTGPGASRGAGCPRDAGDGGRGHSDARGLGSPVTRCHVVFGMLPSPGGSDGSPGRDGGCPSLGIADHLHRGTISLRNLLQFPWGKDRFLPKPRLPNWPACNLAKGEPCSLLGGLVIHDGK